MQNPSGGIGLLRGEGAPHNPLGFYRTFLSRWFISMFEAVSSELFNWISWLFSCSVRLKLAGGGRIPQRHCTLCSAQCLETLLTTQWTPCSETLHSGQQTLLRDSARWKPNFLPLCTLTHCMYCVLYTEYTESILKDEFW